MRKSPRTVWGSNSTFFFVLWNKIWMFEKTGDPWFWSRLKISEKNLKNLNSEWTWLGSRVRFLWRLSVGGSGRNLFLTAASGRPNGFLATCRTSYKILQLIKLIKPIKKRYFFVFLRNFAAIFWPEPLTVWFSSPV